MNDDPIRDTETAEWNSEREREEMANREEGALTWHDKEDGGTEPRASADDLLVFAFFYLGKDWKHVRAVREQRLTSHPNECWSLCKVHRGYLLIALTDVDAPPDNPHDRSFWGENMYGDASGYLEGVRSTLPLTPRTVRGTALEEMCRFGEGPPDLEKSRQLDKLLATARFLSRTISPRYRHFLLSPEGVVYPGLRRLLRQDVSKYLGLRHVSSFSPGSMLKLDEQVLFGVAGALDPASLYNSSTVEELRRESHSWFYPPSKEGFNESAEGGVWDKKGGHPEGAPQPYPTVLEVEKLHVLYRLNPKRGRTWDRFEEQPPTKKALSKR